MTNKADKKTPMDIEKALEETATFALQAVDVGSNFARIEAIAISSRLATVQMYCEARGNLFWPAINQRLEKVQEVAKEWDDAYNYSGGDKDAPDYATIETLWRFELQGFASFLSECVKTLPHETSKTEKLETEATKEREATVPADGSVPKVEPTPEGLRMLIDSVQGEGEQKSAQMQAILMMRIVAKKKGRTVSQDKIAKVLGLQCWEDVKTLSQSIHRKTTKRPYVSRPGEGLWNKTETDEFFRFGNYGPQIKAIIKKMELKKFCHEKK